MSLELKFLICLFGYFLYEVIFKPSNKAILQHDELKILNPFSANKIMIYICRK